MTDTAVARPSCWWCGAIADSREHKFTAYELRLANGPGPWIGDGAVVHGDFSEKLLQVQGPNSALAKFPPSMCANCNNARSQPFDRAYQKMLAYIVDHEEEMGTSRRFRFSEVYGADWAAERTNLIKYFVKHACCRAVESGVQIPDGVRGYLNDPSAIGAAPHFHFTLSIQQDMLELRLTGDMPWGSFFGDAEVYTNEARQVSVIRSHYSWGWFRYYWLLNADDPLGTTTFEGDLVEMGREALPAEERASFPTFN